MISSKFKKTIIASDAVQKRIVNLQFSVELLCKEIIQDLVSNDIKFMNEELTDEVYSDALLSELSKLYQPNIVPYSESLTCMGVPVDYRLATYSQEEIDAFIDEED